MKEKKDGLRVHGERKKNGKVPAEETIRGIRYRVSL